MKTSAAVSPREPELCPRCAPRLGWFSVKCSSAPMKSAHFTLHPARLLSFRIVLGDSRKMESNVCGMPLPRAEVDEPTDTMEPLGGLREQRGSM
eukprot:scaffold130463_cov31-Tisochrysis_lutea.AAC.2